MGSREEAAFVAPPGEHSVQELADRPGHSLYSEVKDGLTAKKQHEEEEAGAETDWLCCVT